VDVRTEIVTRTGRVRGALSAPEGGEQATVPASAKMAASLAIMRRCMGRTRIPVQHQFPWRSTSTVEDPAVLLAPAVDCAPRRSGARVHSGVPDAAAASPLLYEALADHLASMIEKGTLRAGDRLPSVRRLSFQQRVSVSTVLQAYVLLESRGLAEARPQSGHYVRATRRPTLPEPRVARVATTSSKVTTSDLVAKLYGAVGNPSIVPLGSATVSPELLPTEKLNRRMSAIARTAGGVGVSYDPPPGCLALRRQIARRSVEWGCAFAADDLITTVGAMEALHLCLRAVAQAGDTVAIESPAYYGLLQLIESLGIRALEIPAHPRTGMDLDALAVALKTERIKACLAVTNFSNPLGSLMPDDAKRDLVALLAERDVPLIEDDVCGDLHFGESRPRPAKSFDRDGLVMLCSGFSKTLAPGYRIGWVAPGRYREKIERLKFAQTVATPTLPQLACAEFLDNGGYEHHLRQLRRKLAGQVMRMSESIAEHFPDGTRISRPAGGCVLWVELPTGTNALELQARALERGISIAPGPIFSARQRFTNCIRIACGNPWSDRIERAMVVLARLAASSR
jgi:DNA-binding transcriptional MocR family regulator